MTIPIQSISRLLPQTQCRECGYEGCLPYARALSAGEAPVNLCAPGGETVMKDIADLLGKPYLAPAKTQIKAVALIDEAVCIGCTACIRACPVDAIMGASKLMHTVISDECTGCGLCVTPCPVDCIDMVPVSQPFLPSHAVSAPLPNRALPPPNTHKAVLNAIPRANSATMPNAKPYWRNAKPPSKPNRPHRHKPKQPHQAPHSTLWI